MAVLRSVPITFSFFCCHLKNIAFYIFFFVIFFTQPALADISVANTSSGYVIWDSTAATQCQQTFTNTNGGQTTKDSCFSVFGVSGLPTFSDTSNSKFAEYQSQIGLALFLILWQEFAVYLLFSLLLASFLLLLP
jgi:hypothetical protein